MHGGLRQFGAHSEVDWRSLGGGVREVAPTLFGAASASAAGEHPCKVGGPCKCGGSCGGPSAGAKSHEPVAVWQPPLVESFAPTLSRGAGDFQATITLPESGLRAQAPTQGVAASRSAGTPSAEHVARIAVIANLTQVLASPDLNANTRQAIAHALMQLPQRWHEIWSGRAGPESRRLAKAVLGGTDSPPSQSHFLPLAPHGGQQETTEEFVRSGGFLNWGNFRLALRLLSLADAAWHRSGNVFALLLLALLFALAHLTKNCGGKLMKIGQSCAGKKASCCEPPLVCNSAGFCGCPPKLTGSGCSDDCPCPFATDCVNGSCQACTAPTGPGQAFTKGCPCPTTTTPNPTTGLCDCEVQTVGGFPCHPNCGCDPPLTCGKDASGDDVCLCPECKDQFGDPCSLAEDIAGCAKCNCAWPWKCNGGKCGCPPGGIGTCAGTKCPGCPPGQSCTMVCDIGGNWHVCNAKQAAQYAAAMALGKGGVTCGCGSTTTLCICDQLKAAKPKDVGLEADDFVTFTTVKALCK